MAEQIFFGIDPGSVVAGYGVLRSKKEIPAVPADFEVVDCGALRVDASLPSTERIQLLHASVFELLATHEPTYCILEKAFFDKNASSALRLGEVRGSLIAAAGRLGINVKEITPASVKKMIAGNGRATKDEVSRAVRGLFRITRDDLPHDVTDALAIALSFGISYAGHIRLEALGAAKSGRDVIK